MYIANQHPLRTRLKMESVFIRSYARRMVDQKKSESGVFKMALIKVGTK